jgi:predicted flap endonuclease-1-like 5' DNA nuclease
MIPVEHVIEIALLVLVAYLGGCILGYAAHGAVRRHAARPRLAAIVPAPAAPQASAAPPQRPPANRSAARRLAGAVERAQAEPVRAAAPTQIRPPDLPAPRQGQADNLRAIKGIGPKTESALNDLGIYHHDQIAAWTPGHIDWLEGRIALKGRIGREQWVEQAVLLATATAQGASPSA